MPKFIVNATVPVAVQFNAVEAADAQEAIRQVRANWDSGALNIDFGSSDLWEQVGGTGSNGMTEWQAYCPETGEIADHISQDAADVLRRIES